jgi:hypothetical protein
MSLIPRGDEPEEEEEEDGKEAGPSRAGPSLEELFRGALRINDKKLKYVRDAEQSKLQGKEVKVFKPGSIRKFAVCGTNTNSILPGKSSYKEVVDDYNRLLQQNPGRACKDTQSPINIDDVVKLKKLTGTLKDARDAPVVPYTADEDNGNSHSVPRTLCVKDFYDPACKEGGLVYERIPLDSVNTYVSEVNSETRLDDLFSQIDDEEDAYGIAARNSITKIFAGMNDKYMSLLAPPYWPRRLYWIEAPRLVDEAWEFQELRHDGRDLFAKQNLSKGLMIPFFGKLQTMLTEPYTWSFLYEDNDTYYVDGNPQQPECGGDLCIASYAREAEEDENYNMRHFVSCGQFMETFPPSAELATRLKEMHLFPACVFYVLLVDVSAGDKLLLPFDSSRVYNRQAHTRRGTGGRGDYYYTQNPQPSVTREYYENFKLVQNIVDLEAEKVSFE